MEARRPLAGNTATGWLKILALIFMFCDHAGKMLLPGVLEMRMLGRIAFPLYCWCLVVGAQHTRSFPKYLLRIAVIGLISQPLYMVALHHPWTKANIFLTLFVALLGLAGTLAGSFLGVVTANRLVEYRLKQLEDKVNKHNNIIERTYRLEGRVTELEHDVKDLRQYRKSPVQ